MATDFSAKLMKIKLLAMDVDGTLTNGGVYYSKNGEELKRFFVHDGMGITLLRQSNIRTLLITSDSSPIPSKRAEKLGIDYQIIGSKRKITSLYEFLEGLENSIKLEEIAYIGDDVNDIEVMEAVGFAACPQNAVDIIKNTADCVLDFKGGKGAVRQLCDMILLAQNKSIILNY